MSEGSFAAARMPWQPTSTPNSTSRWSRVGPPAPKATDADRDAALERLRDAFAKGRLTDDEFD